MSNNGGQTGHYSPLETKLDSKTMENFVTKSFMKFSAQVMGSEGSTGESKLKENS